MTINTERIKGGGGGVKNPKQGNTYSENQPPKKKKGKR